MRVLEHDELHELAEYRAVVVSGPQRAGTNFVSHAIAHDTGLQYVPETTFGATWPQRWLQIVASGQNVVVHCPGMCRWMHMIGGDEVAVVVVRRDVDDIIASQERIGWKWEHYELMLYDRGPNQGPIAKVKYDFWKQQREHIANPFEIYYERMKEHPLWVSKEQRADFSERQVSIA